MSGGPYLRDDDKRDATWRCRGFPTCALGVYRLEVAGWAEVDAKMRQLLGLFIPPFEKLDLPLSEL